MADIREAQRVLNHEIYRYNYHQVYSTAQAVIYFRFQRALQEKRTLFRAFTVRPPYQTAKDIFCLRIKRTVDPYRGISINTLQLKVNNATHLVFLSGLIREVKGKGPVLEGQSI